MSSYYSYPLPSQHLLVASHRLPSCQAWLHPWLMGFDFIKLSASFSAGPATTSVVLQQFPKRWLRASRKAIPFRIVFYSIKESGVRCLMSSLSSFHVSPVPARSTSFKRVLLAAPRWYVLIDSLANPSNTDLNGKQWMDSSLLDNLDIILFLFVEMRVVSNHSTIYQ